MCCTITTPDDHELDTANDLVKWLQDYIGHSPELIIHPLYRKNYTYDPNHCLCPFDLEGTFLANEIPFEATQDGDYCITAPDQRRST